MQADCHGNGNGHVRVREQFLTTIEDARPAELGLWRHTCGAPVPDPTASLEQTPLLAARRAMLTLTAA